jgi:hypothetical protein
MFRFCVACFYCLIALAPAAIVIDDFSTPQSVPLYTSQTVIGSGILGQERYVWTNNHATAEINTTYSNQAFFSTATDFLSASLHYDGIGSNQNGLNSMDLTEGGQNTGFLITITDVGPVGAFVHMTVGQGSNQSSDLGFWVSGPGDLLFPFADFEASPETASMPTEDPLILPAAYDPVDFTNVGYISLYVGSEEQLSRIALGSIAIVPEPATLSMLALGGLLLSRRKA